MLYYKPIPKIAKRLFIYSEKIGDLIWNSRPLSDFKTYGAWKRFHTLYAGKIAGCINKVSDYRTTPIHDSHYTNHRIIWYLITGKQVPEGYEIDHKNNKPHDNRKVNLHIIKRQENICKRGRHKNNQSGLKNVCWHKATNRWQSKVNLNGVTVYCEYFYDKYEAYFHACFWKHVFHGKFARDG